MRQLSIWDYLQRLLLTIVVVGFFAIMFMIAWAIIDALILLFIGLLISVILRTLAKPIIRYTPINEVFAVISVILLLVIIIALGAWLFVPELIVQTEALIVQINAAIVQVEQFLLQYAWGQDILEILFQQDPSQLPFQDLVPRFTDTFSLTLEGLTNILFMVFIGIFVALNPSLYRSGLLALMPPGGRKRTNEIIDAIVAVLRGWLLGQFISMCLIGVVVGIGLSVLGIPLALLLGIISGLFEFVPILGPIIASVPGILIAFTMGIRTALYVTLFYLVIQQLEGNIITPMVQRKTVHLPPALTITAILIMSLLFGPLAVFIATPLAAIIMVLVKMIYIEDILGSL